MARVKVYAISTQRRTLDTIAAHPAIALSLSLASRFVQIISADTFSYTAFLPCALTANQFVAFSHALHTNAKIKSSQLKLNLRKNTIFLD